MDTGPEPAVPSAVAAADDVRTGRRTSEQLVRACLDVIEQREPRVRAWAHLDADHALEQARARDVEPARGPLHGVPVGVKDIIDTADLPTARGSSVWEGRQPDLDATCVQRLRAAGAVILGKTVTTEVALFHPGPTRNPHDVSRTPGGSSSGSAAAVAAGMVPLALGTQTAGSIVRPAAYCGVVGFKPTFDRVPTEGVLPVGPTLDTVGPIGLHVEDVACAGQVLGGDEASFIAADVPVRLGLARTPWWERVAPSARERLAEAFEALEHAEIATPHELPDSLGDLVEVQETVMAAEASRQLGALRRANASQFSETLGEYLDRGERIPAGRYEAALARADQVRQQELPAAFDGVDALLVPAVVNEPPKADSTGDPVLCRPWTLLGTPAVAVPGLAGEHGLPLGVQVVALPGDDRDALSAAALVARHLSDAG
ncbi:amidase [Egibacter rhizosphaerae]|uniref:Amidase n=1 Tax=Egibacter rhizosphaerae TaxID=1670831 RepID=A0A411YD21_9ACTN|nr:amidase [Egibacter rhizosphaerae]QBI19088.1 amidase [Egibacter rhizosphaerae]